MRRTTTADRENEMKMIVRECTDVYMTCQPVCFEIFAANPLDLTADSDMQSSIAKPEDGTVAATASGRRGNLRRRGVV